MGCDMSCDPQSDVPNGAHPSALRSPMRDLEYFITQEFPETKEFKETRKSSWETTRKHIFVGGEEDGDGSIEGEKNVENTMKHENPVQLKQQVVNNAINRES